jgi:hypothetical protein
MTDAPSPVSADVATDRRPRRRRRVLAGGAVVVILAATAVLDLAHPLGASPSHPFSHPPTRSAASAASADQVATQPVTRGQLSAQTTVDATLGYAANYTVTNQYAASNSTDPAPTNGGSAGGQSPSAGSGSGSGTGQGVVTGLPKAGQLITQGQALYWVDGVPVVLLYGSTPAYRTLAEGAAAADMTGADVRQLNADLVALGYASKSDLDPSSDEFSAATKDGIDNLQEHLGLDQTGTLDLGSVVFLPTPLRVTNVSTTLNASIGRGSPVLTGTSTTRQVNIALDTSKQSEVRVGDQVSVELPNSQTTPGVVSAVGTVAASSGSGGGGQPASSGADNNAPSSSSNSNSSSSSGSTIEVDVRLIHPATAAAWDQAPVQVTITTDTVKNALVVPVLALLAQSVGGYAVEVASADGTRHLVPVTLGLFDDTDGLVQVTSNGLAAGQHVVVPKL